MYVGFQITPGSCYSWKSCVHTCTGNSTSLSGISNNWCFCLSIFSGFWKEDPAVQYNECRWTFDSLQEAVNIQIWGKAFWIVVIEPPHCYTRRSMTFSCNAMNGLGFLLFFFFSDRIFTELMSEKDAFLNLAMPWYHAESEKRKKYCVQHFYVFVRNLLKPILTALLCED